MPCEEEAADASAQHRLVFKCSETRVPPGPTLSHAALVASLQKSACSLCSMLVLQTHSDSKRRRYGERFVRLPLLGV